MVRAQPPADIDPRLLSEALRRACARRPGEAADADRLFPAILAAARRGARDLYSLVKAAENAGLGGAD